MLLEEIKNLIPNSENFESAKKLTLGWSDEEKYIVSCSGARVLLRVLKKESFEAQLKAIKSLQKFSQTSKLVPKVLDFGLTKDENSGYILLEYINGFNAMETISEYTIKEQYEFGVAMGETIKLFHQQSKKEIIESEKNKFLEKVKNFLNYYHENKNQFNFLSDKEPIINSFLEKVKNRPYVMLHNDFHLGNMILDENKISLIDFNRATYGDYIKEFDGIAWCVKVSKYFAQGIIDAYLFDEDEDEFFAYLKGYINIWQVQMLYFIKDQDDEEKNIVINLIKSVEQWYNGDGKVPSWYSE